MLIASVITGYLDRVVLELTPAQRWDAVRSFEGGANSILINVIAGIAVIAVLVAIFVFVNSNKAKSQKNFSDKLFIELSQTRGLTLRQRQLLLDVAINAGLKRNESIFTLSSAFDRSALQLVQQGLEEQGLDESENIKIELAFIREKLGFKTNETASQAKPIEPNRVGASSTTGGASVGTISAPMTSFSPCRLAARCMRTTPASEHSSVSASAW